jgi:UDP-N-acetylglucosamine 4,6-dehydratase/5-epimerase
MHDKVVLITGGTGSFGQACVKTILARYRVKKVIVFSRDEFKQAEMAAGFSPDQYPIRYFIGDVRDKERLKWAFQEVDFVIHAAAMKQVPASEYNPTECIRTNIAGSENVVNAAAESGVKKVIALSTDKAVSPVNLYGATKLCAEKLFIAANAFVGRKKCLYAVVRYGNVAGSRGSVVPLFMKKKDAGVLPVTHPDMTRFWLTLEQGVDFVLKSLERMTGGETFVPKVPSLKIMDLAKHICPACEIKIIGIRQGEKIHETLISKDEARNTLEAKAYYVIKPDSSFISSQINEDDYQPVPDDFEYNSRKTENLGTGAWIDGMLASVDIT